MKASVAPRAARILDYIAGPESKGNYLAYFGHGGNTEALPATIGDVLQFQSDLVQIKKQKSSAVGRYQFMPATLRSLIASYKLPATTPFTPDEQDVLACALLERRGYSAWATGKLSNDDFADHLSMAWASLPYNTGKSYYDSDGLNHSLVKRSDFVAMLTAAAKLPNHAATPEPAVRQQEQPDPPPTQPAPTSVANDPFSAFFQDLGGLFASHFGDALTRVLTPTLPQVAPPAADDGSSSAGQLETGIVLKLAELFLSNFSSFASYATVLPHLATEIPDIIAKGEAMVKGVEQLIADIKAGKIGNAPNDFQAVFTAIEGILNDVGINLGTVTSTIALMPQLPSVAGIQAIPTPALAKAA